MDKPTYNTSQVAPRSSASFQRISCCCRYRRRCTHGFLLIYVTILSELHFSCRNRNLADFSCRNRNSGDFFVGYRNPGTPFGPLINIPNYHTFSCERRRREKILKYWSYLILGPFSSGSTCGDRLFHYPREVSLTTGGLGVFPRALNYFVWDSNDWMSSKFCLVECCFTGPELCRIGLRRTVSDRIEEFSSDSNRPKQSKNQYR